MKTLVITLACCLAIIGQAWGNGVTRPETENYLKGVEALNGGDAVQAYRYLNREIDENPTNGYAHCYMALVCHYYGDMKLAMHAVNEGLKLIPESDAEYRSFAYYTRGSLFLNMKAYASAVDDLSCAINLTPGDVENYKTRAEAYMNAGKYQESLADLQTVMKLDARADVYDLVMQLLEANPDPAFFNQVTDCFNGMTAQAQ